MNISTQELADIYASLVAPVLQEMFAPESKSPPVKVDVSSLAAGIVAAFGAFDLGVEAVGVVEGPQVTRIKLMPSSESNRLTMRILIIILPSNPSNSRRLGRRKRHDLNFSPSTKSNSTQRRPISLKALFHASAFASLGTAKMRQIVSRLRYDDARCPRLEISRPEGSPRLSCLLRFGRLRSIQRTALKPSGWPGFPITRKIFPSTLWRRQ